MKAHFFNAKKWLVMHWRGLLSAIIIALLAVTTLGLQINSLVPGFNKYELDTLKRIESPVDLTFRAVNITYNLPAHYLGNALNNELLGARIVSLVYVLLSILLLFLIVKKIFNIRMATIGSLLFITSSWVLAISHQATPLSLLIFSPLLVLAAFAWYVKNKKQKYIYFLMLAGALAYSAYTPYMFWIIAACVTVYVILNKTKLFNYKRWQLILAGGIYLVILTPLILSLSKYPGQIKELLGIPLNLPSFSEYINRSVDLLSSLFIASSPLPELHLGQLPILDIFSATMFILGFYYFIKHINKKRSLMLISSVAILYAILPLNPLYALNMSILLPFIYIFVIAGIVELIRQWYAYFPRNPWARYFGMTLVVIAIALSSFYNLSRYYIAWPNTPETKAVYMIKSKE